MTKYHKEAYYENIYVCSSIINEIKYDEKQVVSYMKKLNKEFKQLTHGFGAALGYSMINDAIKTVDDAINEATTDMKDNKEELDY